MLGAEPETGDGDGQPLWIPGVKAVQSSKHIGKYYTPALFYYLDFYLQCKRNGLPFTNFMEAPFWVLQLQTAFDHAYKEIETYQVRQVQSSHPSGGRHSLGRRFKGYDDAG